MRIVLVGGAGFIGSNLAQHLKHYGDDVWVVDNLSVNNYYYLLEHGQNKLHLKILEQRLADLKEAGIPVFISDARDYHLLSRIIGPLKPDVIIHLAAIAHMDRANKDPYSTFDHSLRTLENSLDIARTLKIERLIYFSSSTVYGDFTKSEVTEDEPCDPKGIYGALKLAGELMVKAYNQVFDLPYTIIRPSALYGPGCISGRVVQKFIEQVLAGGQITVDGDGMEMTDFTYISDLISGVSKCFSAKAKNQTFNLTAGNARTLIDLIQCIAAKHGEVKYKFGKRDPLRPMRGTLSIAKARLLLDYAPLVDLETGVGEYMEWYKCH